MFLLKIKDKRAASRREWWEMMEEKFQTELRKTPARERFTLLEYIGRHVGQTVFGYYVTEDPSTLTGYQIIPHNKGFSWRQSKTHKVKG